MKPVGAMLPSAFISLAMALAMAGAYRMWMTGMSPFVRAVVLGFVIVVIVIQFLVIRRVSDRRAKWLAWAMFLAATVAGTAWSASMPIDSDTNAPARTYLSPDQE